MIRLRVSRIPSVNFGVAVKSLQVGVSSYNPLAGTIVIKSGGTINWATATFAEGIYSSVFQAGSLAIVSDNNASGNFLFGVSDSGINFQQWAVVSQGANVGATRTKPIASAAPGTSVAFGVAWQNPAAWDVSIILTLAITANTSLVVQAGVGPTNTPTQQTLITGVTLTGIIGLKFRVPAGYYLLLSESGTGTISIMGQMLENS